jgi:Na+-transporting methylmalonyl-CoA/oxaloacetate decarboxylase gamma subunit
MLDRLFYSLELAVVGMSVVLTALIFFSFIIWLMKFIDAKISSSKVQNTLNESDDNLIAVISAAVYVALGKKARIKHIQFLDTQTQDGSWAVAGRLNVMSSHNINKRI